MKLLGIKYFKRNDTRSVEEKLAHNFLASCIDEQQERDQRLANEGKGWRIYSRFRMRLKRRRSKFGSKSWILKHVNELKAAIENATEVLNRTEQILK